MPLVAVQYRLHTPWTLHQTQAGTLFVSAGIVDLRRALQMGLLYTRLMLLAVVQQPAQ